MRARRRVVVVLLVVILAIGIYGYFTTPLPFGLSSVIRTPGGAAGGQPSAAPPSARSAAGQPLVLGAVNVEIQAVQRNQEVGVAGRGQAGSFTVVQLALNNGGTEPVSPQPADFRLLDDRGRSYAVDVEATRSANNAARRRYPFETSVPPGGRLETMLAFETASDAAGLSLRVTLGYGELELPR
jgi:hypothetical protein